MKSKVKKQNSDLMQETTVQDLKVTSSCLCWTYQWTGDMQQYLRTGTAWVRHFCHSTCKHKAKD